LIPRVVHFVFGLRSQDEPFHLLHYIAIASCLAVVQPDEIVLHVHQLPYGLYWDLARPLVRLERIDPIEAVDRVVPEEFRPFAYALHADVIRLDVLEREGGMYADIDTVFCQPVPDALWRAEAVIGREADVTYPDSPMAEPSLTNALMMAQPGAWFTSEWRRRILGAMDATWSGHSCRLATRLADEWPDRVHVEPQARFSPYDHTPAGLRALLEEPLVPAALEASTSVHLMAHLWWGRNRRDFVAFSAGDASEAHLRESDTPLAHLARPYLPTHGLF
jgi:Glycosyltransferase sugar-binding region containing DXD motif